MLEYIKGTLVESSLQKVTIEIQGLGYRLFIPFNNYAKLPQVGSLVTIFVSTVIREDAHKRYGFIDREQRDLFESLIEISGIGPKTALALLGHMEISDLQCAISQGKSELICKIPGIGKKTSERLIIEMRDKMKKIEEKTGGAVSSREQTLLSDAISAMINLGYNAAQAQKATKAALEKSKPHPDLAQLITHALRLI